MAFPAFLKPSSMAIGLRLPPRRPSGYTTSYVDIDIPPQKKRHVLFRLHVCRLDDARPFGKLGFDKRAEARRVHQRGLGTLAHDVALHVCATDDFRGCVIKKLDYRPRRLA